MEEEKKPAQESLDEVVKSFREGLEKVNNAISNDKDAEELKTDPMVILYNQIVENTISLIKDETAAKLFDTIRTKLGEDATSSLITYIAFSMCTSAFHSIVFYDALIKSEINENFNKVHKEYLDLKSFADAYGATLNVFRKRLDELDKSVKLKDINKDI